MRDCANFDRMSVVAGSLPLVPAVRPRDAALSRETLMGIAVARGCRHYAPLVPGGMASTASHDLPHEVLGAALLRGPTDAATFQAIRCGAMVLSDLGNSARRIGEAADYFGVAHRVAHIARLALEADTHPDYWTTLLALLPAAEAETEFLPGVSRFVSETRMTGFGGGPARVWLRTRCAG